MAPAERALGLGVEIVKRSQDTKGFQVLNRNGDDDTFTPQKEMGKHDPNATTEPMWTTMAHPVSARTTIVLT